ncbi:hypothetical protein [Jatrophihabitans sp.]|jgi:hypothetical protein|uniref:hypothetical protein n=1 Tax=Jatrophihabitans sp. TaxID=1932789 RepID=UPI002F105553
MAWVWWLLAPVASTALGAIVIWWRTPAETGRRRRRADAISEHQALLRALAQQPPVGLNPSGSPSGTAQVAPHQPVLDGSGQPVVN